jgi:hemerythrin-like metal-binding protein
MAYFQWSDDLSVGNKHIDSDHKKLLDLCNNLHDAMAQGKGKDVLGKTLGELIQYTKEHFKREEEEMRRINYSNTVAHRQEHDKLIQDVLKLQKEFGEGNAFLTVQV